jgi:hypothetical protein
VPSSNTFAKEWGNEQEYHEVSNVGQAKTIVLTFRIHLAIGIDKLGHERIFKEIFLAMGFTTTNLTISGLRQIWKKKEYGRMYSSLWKVKRRRRMQQQDQMIERRTNMKLDAKEVQGYSPGIWTRRESNKEESEEKKRNKKKARMGKQCNNQLTGSKRKEWMCGREDHVHWEACGRDFWR